MKQKLPASEPAALRASHPAESVQSGRFSSTVSQPTDSSSDSDNETEAPIDPREKPMGFFEHLEELRWTLVKSAIAFVACACLVGVFLKQFNHVLLQPLTRIAAEYPDVKVELGTTSIMEGFSVVIQMCTVGGLLLASPFIVFFFGQFVSPALTKKELKMVAPVGLSAVVLFVLGCSFSFWLLVPSTIRVSIELNQLFGFALRWTPAAYYSLLTWLVAGVGASFEFPLVIVLAVYMGLLEVATLRKYRRHAVVGIFILAAVVTPTPDPFTQTMFALPLYALFELAILAGSRISKRRAEAMES
ncbi:MAG: twin-arginine translocase subunit TatC [Opitutaceae bacterium]|nr:twin-arginine translocase subunit TatC [Opitutaceae bacterium]